jgi:PAS domain S-box-containing protein
VGDDTGNRRFQAEFSASPNAIFLLEGETFVDCNPAALRVLGDPVLDHVVGRTPADFSAAEAGTSELTPGRLAAFARAAMGGVTQLFEWPVRRTGGSTVLLLVALARTDAAGTPRLQAVCRDITAERESERRFRHLFDSSPDPCWIINENNLFVLCNQAAADILGYDSIDELASTHPSRLSPEIQPDGLRSFDKANAMMATAHQNGIHRFQWEHRRKDGTCFPVEVTLARMELDGRAQLYCTWYDITARKQADAALRASEERFNLAMQAANDGLWDWDMPSNAVYFSPRWKGMLGYRPEELEDSFAVWERLVDSAGRAETMAAIERCVGGEADGFAVEFRMRHKDGHWVDILSRATIIRDAEGRPLRMVGTHVDISRQKRAEADLLRHQEDLARQVADRTAEAVRAKDAAQSTRRMLQLVLDTIPVRVFWKDNDLRYMGCNKLFAQDAGFEDPEQLLGLDDYDMGWRGQADLYRADDRAVIDADAPKLNFEEPQSTPDGHTIWLRTSKIPLKDDAGRTVGVLGTYEDITARKLVERERDEARERAEKANRIKSEFLANMSHEIRTPMNAVIGMSQLALQTDLDARQRNYVEKANGAAMSLLQVIDDILDFSKIEAGRLSMEFAPFRLEDVMATLSGLVGLRAEQKGQELMFDVEPGVPVALIGDATRLGQVLTNLTSNAIKFTDHGGEVLVRVALEADDGSHVRLHFSVRDNGIGIPPETQRNLFQAFTQADTSTTRRFGGTGLGLIISKRLVEMMDGRIWLESAVGKGSTFHFTATLGCQAHQPEAARLAEIGQPGPRVLIVDDNPTSREVMARQMESLGCRVDRATSGWEAIAMVEQAEESSPFDVVLLDWRMPALDGIETARIIQKHPMLPVPPDVVMVSAFGVREIKQHSAGVHLAATVTKPTTVATLRDAVLVARGCAPEREDTETHRRRPAASGDVAALRGAKILLVEDNDINRELAVELLTQAGILVDCAANGQEALDMLAHTTYAGVLMDCQMPIMDGFEATRRIRAQGSLAELPVIAMTANVMAGDRQRALDAGMNDVIRKPIDAAQMFDTMTAWIRPRAGAELASRGTPEPARGASGLPVIDGVDTAAGLAICLNDSDLYRRLLSKFREGHAGFARQFADALAAGDRKAAAREAHTLKGVAANLGMHVLSDGAQRLESACLNGDDTDAPLREVVASLAAILAGLNALAA